MTNPTTQPALSPDATSCAALPAQTDQHAANSAPTLWGNPWAWGRNISSERRDRQRVPIRRGPGLRCSAGVLLDLSLRGLRVTRRRPIPVSGQIIPITLRSGDTRLTLAGACVWCRRVGFMRYQAGLALAGVSPADRAALMSLVDEHASSPVLVAA